MRDIKDMFKKKVKAVKPGPKPKPKTVTVTVSFEMDDKTADLFLKSSIERVINTSVSIIEHDRNSHEDNQSINLEDWQEWKPAVCMMWNAIHDAIFRVKAEMPANERTYTIQKGDL